MDLQNFCSRLGLEWDVARNSEGQPELASEVDEQLAGSFGDVELAIGDTGSSAGKGTVHITTRRVIWVSADAANSSLACSYRQVSMHAVSRDTSSYSKPCVYIQLDEGSEVMEDDQAEDESEEELTAELRLIPADDSQVEAIFGKLCECSALNPDSDVEDEGGASLFFDEAEVLAGLPDDQRAAVLAARAEGALALQDGDNELDELMADDPDRFEDDEGEEEEQHTPAGATAGNGV